MKDSQGILISSSLPLLPSHQLPDLRQHSNQTFHWVILLICIGILTGAALLNVAGSGVVVPGLNHRLPELCTLRRLTGLSCPGCGLTRCFIALAHGNVTAAWSFNPAGLWLFATIALQLPLRCYQLWRLHWGHQELRLAYWGEIAFLIFLVALLGQWAIRLAYAYS